VGRQGKPLIVPGDGTSLWAITHNSDFAKGLVGLLGHQQAVGHAFHITLDAVLFLLLYLVYGRTRKPSTLNVEQMRGGTVKLLKTRSKGGRNKRFTSASKINRCHTPLPFY
jgi:hypothetical protein